jgi:hypothetical protein
VVINLKSKTFQNVLTEIAGLLVLTRILNLFLVMFNENRFNKKMKKETNEEFREVFTYSNFKKALLKIEDLIEVNNKLIERLDKMEKMIQQ